MNVFLPSLFFFPFYRFSFLIAVSYCNSVRASLLHSSWVRGHTRSSVVLRSLSRNLLAQLFFVFVCVYMLFVFVRLPYRMSCSRGQPNHHHFSSITFLPFLIVSFPFPAFPSSRWGLALVHFRPFCFMIPSLPSLFLELSLANVLSFLF